MKTKLQEMLEKGWTVKISPMVQPDELFSAEMPDGSIVVAVHPMTYSYVAYPWQEAHEINKKLIEQRIDAMAADASAKIDRMVDEMNRKHEPKMFTFTGPLEVDERDGFFEFRRPAEMGGEPFLIVAGKMKEYGEHAMEAAASMQMFTDSFPVSEDTSYSELEESLGRKPNFDEIVRGY